GVQTCALPILGLPIIFLGRFCLPKKGRRFYFVASSSYPLAGCSSAEPASVSLDKSRLLGPARLSSLLASGDPLPPALSGANSAARLAWRAWRAASSLRSRSAKIWVSRPASLSAGAT